MDVIAAILTCSLHYDDALVSAIIDNAHDNPYSVIVPEVSSPGPLAVTMEGAISQLADATLHGERPLLGLMSLPPEWALSFGRNPQDLFDPCTNVSIGTAMLSAFDFECQHGSAPARRKSPNPTARRACVLHRYASAIHMPELITVVALAARYRHEPLVATDSPIAPIAIADPWGSSCLFVPTGSREQTPVF